jgi:hypothetical protein
VTGIGAVFDGAEAFIEWRCDDNGRPSVLGLDMCGIRAGGRSDTNSSEASRMCSPALNSTVLLPVPHELPCMKSSRTDIYELLTNGWWPRD